MHVELVDNWFGLELLHEEWNDLLRASRADSIFLTWEWIRAWIAIVKDSIQPFLIVVRDPSGRLVGLAPYYQSSMSVGGWIPYRVLRVMADHATGAEYSDWIVRTDCESEASQAIADGLAACRDRWDCIWMPNVSGWTGAEQRIIATCRDSGYSYFTRPRAFSAVRLPSDMETYMGALDSKKRKNIRGDIRRVMNHSGVAVRRCENRDDVPQFLDALFDLHHRRWESRGEEGTFRRKPLEAQFYRQFIPIALDRKWLRFYGLEDSGCFKAVQIGYVYNNIFHGLQGGFDPEYVKGVRNVLRVKVIESCIEEGVVSYDFLGEVTEHKKSWRAEERTGFDLLIGHRGFKSRLLFIKKIWPTGRFIRMNQPSPNRTGTGFEESSN